MSGFRDPALERELQFERPLAGPSKRVFGDLTAYLQQPIEEIARAYWAHRRGEDRDAQARVAKATDPETINAYYVTTPHYLYELSYWEATGDKQSWFRVLQMACKRFGLKRVLDFGGGVGGVSVHLRRHGIACDHLDIQGRTCDYARWRFKRHGFPVAIRDAAAPSTWPAGTYDAVVAWDVLEHIFDLEAAVASIGRLLRPGGLFLSKSSFANEDSIHCHIHLARHAPYGDVRVLNDMVSRHGFAFRGQLKPDGVSRLLRDVGFRYTVAGIRVVPRLKHGGNFLVHVRSSPTKER